MKRKFFSLFRDILLSSVFLVPKIVFGQGSGSGTGTGGSGSGSGTGTGGSGSGSGTGSGGSGSGSGTGAAGNDTGSEILENPLKVDTITEFLQLILDLLLIFAVPVIVFFIIYSGFLFVTAQGNDTQLSKAKTALLWTVIGGVIVLGANVLLDVLVNTVQSLQP